MSEKLLGQFQLLLQMDGVARRADRVSYKDEEEATSWSAGRRTSGDENKIEWRKTNLKEENLAACNSQNNTPLLNHFCLSPCSSRSAYRSPSKTHVLVTIDLQVGAILNAVHQLCVTTSTMIRSCVRHPHLLKKFRTLVSPSFLQHHPH